MRHATLAPDLPGRGACAGELVSVTVAGAARAVAAAIAAGAAGADVVLVGHSAAGSLLPPIAAMVGSTVRHLVFVAGIVVADGEVPIDRYYADRAEDLRAMFHELRAEHAGRTLEDAGGRAASVIDALNFSLQPMDWAGIDAGLPRTYIRCLRDEVQTPAMQDLFVASSGATEVVELDVGHTPALEDPRLLAELLDTIADRSQARPSTS